MKRLLALVVLFAATSATGQRNTASAMDMKCSDAEATMTKAHAMAQTSPAMTGDPDKDFMARVEMQCGHRVADRKPAAMLLREAQERLEMFRDRAQS